MPISWNEIRQNAIGFSREWVGARRETAEKQTFWNEFFSVFGLSRRLVASFEEPVKRFTGARGFIDLFWEGTLLVEHKSFGESLDKAESQAFQYIRDLVNEGRVKELPRYVIVSDFARMALYDLEPDEQRDLPLFDRFRVASLEFNLEDFHRYIHAFAFIPGYKQHKFEDQDPINLEAVRIMGDLHDAIGTGGYKGPDLERFLVRVLFCLFAEDTGIFERDSFRLYIENRTAEDGADLGVHLDHLFRVLDTPEERRQANLDEDLARFRYVNGDLFRERLEYAELNREMRNALLVCARFDWSRISPAIFGSLFQAVMEPKDRRQIGAHYTSERDILKVVRSLFLDELKEEFKRTKGKKPELRRFHQRLSALRFLDPACGCGNFLVIAYRELRKLELEVLVALQGSSQQELDVNQLSLVDVDAFYGIEIGEWPARIAEVAMWLVDHQMNLRLSETFGQYFVRLPLKKSPTIVHDNALRRDWREILAPKGCSYILGNPPFVGKKEQSASQKADMRLVWGNFKGIGILDYVSCWYRKTSDYLQKTNAAAAFVSTNSITQGEQVGVLWKELLKNFKININFAHRTFEWQSEAAGKAHVHVVIIGFSIKPFSEKNMFTYESLRGEPIMRVVKNINPYLFEGSNLVISSREQRLCPEAPEMQKGSEVTDEGHLLLTAEERLSLIDELPRIEQWIRPFIGGKEYINGLSRWCLWLKDAPPDLLREKPVSKRLNAVKKFRESSSKLRTHGLSAMPSIFGEDRQPSKEYLLIPKISSERRRYIPMGFLQPEYVVSGSALTVESASLYDFGNITSRMHMAWMRVVGGRMKSDYQYSVTVVYNNFPWPENPTPKQRAAVEAAAQGVLDARAEFPNATLADLYDPLSLPPSLVRAHAALDKAVDLCYRSQPFENDSQRVEHLFALYERLTAPLLPATPKPRRSRSKN